MKHLRPVVPDLWTNPTRFGAGLALAKTHVLCRMKTKFRPEAGAGFTLLEIMIVVAIYSDLALVPSNDGKAYYFSSEAQREYR